MTDLLQHQIAYYSARAPEYDEWFYRIGKYDHGPAFKAQWEAEVKKVRDQLHSGPRCQRILEMAPGTGIWTGELIKLGERVTALDASAEMIAINRAKLQSERVDYVRTDLFQWQPDREYDMVFFGFWLSHVPSERLTAFLETVHAALKPGGRLFFVDSRKAAQSSEPEADHGGRDELQGRVLNDGRRYEIVKIYYDPARLTETLRRHGFDIRVRATQRSFIYGDGLKPA